MNNTPNFGSADIYSLISHQNPFEFLDRSLDYQDIWHDQLFSVNSINSSVFDQVCHAVDRLNVQEQKLLSILIRGDRQSGKSHLINRLYQKLSGSYPDVFFIYFLPDLSVNGPVIHDQLMQAIANSFKQVNQDGIQYWQQLAINLLYLAYYQSDKPEQAEIIKKSAQLVIGGKFDRIQGQNPQYIVKLTETINHLFPEVESNVIKSILWTLSTEYNSWAIQWLSGQRISEDLAERMGLRNHLPSYKVEEAIDFIVNIFWLINDKGLIICHEFNQIEMLNNYQKMASFMEYFTASLNHTPNLPKTILFNFITDNLALEKITDNDSMNFNDQWDLPSLLAIESQELIFLVMTKFYLDNDLVSPDIIYPFTVDDINKFVKTQPSIGKLISWCVNYVNEPPQSDLLAEIFSTTRNNIDQQLSSLKDNQEMIAASLLLFFSLLRNETEKLPIIALEKVSPEYSYLVDFKLCILINNQPENLGIRVITTNDLKGLSNLINELYIYSKSTAEKICIFSVENQCDELSAEIQSPIANIHLTEEDLLFLLTTFDIFHDRESHQVTKLEIKEYLKKQNQLENNPIITKLSQITSQIITA